jgi:hypothetical protein
MTLQVGVRVQPDRVSWVPHVGSRGLAAPARPGPSGPRVGRGGHIARQAPITLRGGETGLSRLDSDLSRLMQAMSSEAAPYEVAGLQPHAEAEWEQGFLGPLGGRVDER